MLPSPRGAGSVRDDPGQVDPRPVPRAQPDLVFGNGARCRASMRTLYQFGRLDGAHFDRRVGAPLPIDNPTVHAGARRGDGRQPEGLGADLALEPDGAFGERVATGKEADLRPRLLHDQSFPLRARLGVAMDRPIASPLGNRPPTGPREPGLTACRSPRPPDDTPRAARWSISDRTRCVSWSTRGSAPQPRWRSFNENDMRARARPGKDRPAESGGRRSGVVHPAPLRRARRALAVAISRSSPPRRCATPATAPILSPRSSGVRREDSNSLGS